MARVNIYSQRPIQEHLSMRAGDTITIEAKLFDDDDTKVNLTGATVTFKMRNLGENAFHIDAAATIDTAVDGEVSFALSPSTATTYPGNYEIFFRVKDSSDNEISYPGRGQWRLDITGATDIDSQSLLQDAIQAAARIYEATAIVVITAAKTFDATHMGKIIHLDSSGGAFTVTYPDPDTNIFFKNGMGNKLVLIDATNVVTIASDVGLKIADTTMSTIDEFRNIYCDLTGSNFWRDG